MNNVNEAQHSLTYLQGDFMLKKLADVAQIRLCLTQKQTADKMYKILTPIKLLEHNIIDGYVLDDKIRADKTTKVCSGDIIIKRISPSFVNYIDNIDDNVYAAGNLIIITAKTVDSKYLAYILNIEIPKITQSLSGSSIPAINIGDLEEIKIPFLSIEKQRVIGTFWQKSIEIYKLKTRLNELEQIKAKNILAKALNGGIFNG